MDFTSVTNLVSNGEVLSLRHINAKGNVTFKSLTGELGIHFIRELLESLPNEDDGSSCSGDLAMLLFQLRVDSENELDSMILTKRIEVRFVEFYGQFLICLIRK